MNKYSIDDVTITIHNEFFRILEILPFNKYRGLVRDNTKPLNLFITVKDEDEIKSVLGKARHPLLKVFDIKIEGIDNDENENKEICIEDNTPHLESTVLYKEENQ